VIEIGRSAGADSWVCQLACIAVALQHAQPSGFVLTTAHADLYRGVVIVVMIMPA
jgi:hypothetical protein